MNMLFRNFFYSVGFLTLFFLYGSDAGTVAFADFVRLVQSPIALKMALALTVLLIGLEFIFGRSAHVGCVSDRPAKLSNSGSFSQELCERK